MNKSIVLASLVATVALAACSKKEEVVVPAPAPVVVTPAPSPSPAPAPSTTVVIETPSTGASAPGMAASR